ncbi:uncharacterized protein LOC130622980 [Hydractinia symbiolongicarpus]|uniref:uncharacterized protein LOC130622980 n=1 Tax=Hydractinia symbiolongicarpus TaxID=13093 RepID=UPI00254AF70A|nr:uncharacterized protein LOC130622980 [Hydractinia symbiolongicarpus]
MFMSTRYNKRPEPSIKQQKIFSVDDSLAKLCGYITNEFSCSKLITPKYKDFRSQKLKFDQKTRLNNAIWRAWHIQYKQKKKARFLQFAAPFSDVSAHSTSQAVILEGKYWRRRLDAVSREFKKWRRLYKEKLLRNGDLTRENLEVSDEEKTSSEDSDTENEVDDDGVNNKRNGSKSIKSLESSISFDTLSAMYAFPDTLFSSVDQKKTNDLEELALFKDTSGIIQPTLDHLNPCFDELMENFDFLFTDWENYNQGNNSREPSDLMLDSYSASNRNVQSNLVTNDQFLHTMAAGSKSSSENNLGVSTFNGKQSCNGNSFQDRYQQLGNTVKSASSPAILSVEDGLKETDEQSHYQELPPQLQAPNLAAHVQAAMSNRPKGITRNKSDSNLTTLSKRSSNKKDCSPVQTKKPCLRRNASGNNLFELKSTPVEHREVRQQHTLTASVLATSSVKYQSNASGAVPKKVSTVPILPKYTQAPTFPVTLTAPLNRTGIIVSRDITHAGEGAGAGGLPASKPQTVSSFPTYAVIGGNSNLSQAQAQMVNAISIMPLSNPNIIQPNLIPTIINSNRMMQPGIPALQAGLLPANLGVLPQNDQQLLTLAQLLQSTPTQGTEATLNYLELLQQQLNLMVKQQQEQIQLKYQIQMQAEKMLQEKRQQLSKQARGAFSPEFITHHVTSPQFHSTQTIPHCSPGVMATMSSTHTDTCNTKIFSSSSSYPQNQLFISTSTEKPAFAVEKEILSDDSPKLFKKESQSLVKTLHEMAPPGGVQQIDLKAKLSTHKNSPSISDELRPPATMDSAMALVSLRHGQIINETSQACGSSSNYRRTYEDVGQTEYDTNDSLHPSKPITKVADRIIYNEHRRQCHLSAEQKRRGLIKNAFEELSQMIPSKGLGRGSKLSNSAILQLTCDYIQVLQRERASCDVKMNHVQQQIDQMQAAINECQNKLPTTGASTSFRQGSDTVKRSFTDYCKDLIYKKPESWIFCVMMKPLFESFNAAVTTKTLDEFLSSVILWLDRHCTLPLLRPAVLKTLTELSTTTSILENPNCLSVLAERSLQKEDPCELSGANQIAGVDNAAMSTSSSRWNS